VFHLHVKKQDIPGLPLFFLAVQKIHAILKYCYFRLYTVLLAVPADKTGTRIPEFSFILCDCDSDHGCPPYTIPLSKLFFYNPEKPSEQ